MCIADGAVTAARLDQGLTTPWGAFRVGCYKGPIRSTIRAYVRTHIEGLGEGLKSGLAISG